ASVPLNPDRTTRDSVCAGGAGAGQYGLTAMGLRLSVQRTSWLRGVEAAAAARPGLVPVVKGNGYGFGRPTLMPIAARLAPSGTIAVGTVYEAADVPGGVTALVLTPHVDTLPAGLAATTVLTVG